MIFVSLFLFRVCLSPSASSWCPTSLVLWLFFDEERLLIVPSFVRGLHSLYSRAFFSSNLFRPKPYPHFSNEEVLFLNSCILFQVCPDWSYVLELILLFSGSFSLTDWCVRLETSLLSSAFCSRRSIDFRLKKRCTRPSLKWYFDRRRSSEILVRDERDYPFPTTNWWNRR